ncbi:MAG: hypothetical protein WCH33_04395 [Betaproteobacteria bacterium]|jgi:hypothetical protein
MGYTVANNPPSNIDSVLLTTEKIFATAQEANLALEVQGTPTAKAEVYFQIED